MDSIFKFVEESPSNQWKKPTESMHLVRKLIDKGIAPRHVLSLLYPRYSTIPPNIPDYWIVQLLRELSETHSRKKLPQWNTFEDAVQLFRKSQRILIITGAGVSVSCGIPDFRSENGVYARLRKDFPELPDPHAMFDIDFFRHNPAPFYNFAKEIFPGQFRPSISHMFIKFLEDERKLLRNYTQNIDTLERQAGIKNLVECHGSFARATCLGCGTEVDSELIRADVFAQRIPACSQCQGGIIKPNIVFFGEDLGDTFHGQMADDHQKLDLLVVIGSSMQVRPVSLVPFNIGAEVPQILINRELLASYPADIKLLGNCDAILAQLAVAIGGGMRAKMLQELESRKEPSSFLMALKNSDEHEFQPRRLSMEEFKQRIGGVSPQNEAKNAEEFDAEPSAAKKPKLDDSKELGKENGSETKKDGEKAREADWARNFVLVESQLPTSDSTLLIPPNLNIFAGAKLFYNRDKDKFVGEPGGAKRSIRHLDEYDDEEEEELARECGDGDSSTPSTSNSDSDATCSSDEDDSKGTESLPAEFERIFGVENDDEFGQINENQQKRAESCPPLSRRQSSFSDSKED